MSHYTVHQMAIMNNYNVIWEYAGVQRKQQEILYGIQLQFLIVYGHIYHAVGYNNIQLKHHINFNTI